MLAPQNTSARTGTALSRLCYFAGTYPLIFHYVQDIVCTHDETIQVRRELQNLCLAADHNQAFQSQCSPLESEIFTSTLPNLVDENFTAQLYSEQPDDVRVPLRKRYGALELCFVCTFWKYRC